MNFSWAWRMVGLAIAAAWSLSQSWSSPGDLYCHSARCQVFATCAVVMHLLSLKACSLNYSTDSFLFWLMWKIWVFVMISFRQAGQPPSVCVWQKFKRCNLLGHYNYDIHQTLHDGSTHWALLIHTTFSDLDCISRSQHCQTVLTAEFYVLIWLSWNFEWLLITSSRSWLFLFLHIFKGDNRHILIWKFCWLFLRHH